MKRCVFMLLVLCATVSTSNVVAKKYPASDTPIFIKNKHSRCVSRSEDEITLKLKGLRFQRQGSFLKKDSNLRLVVGARPQARNTGSTSAEVAYQYPIVRNIQLQNVPNGFVQKTGEQAALVRDFTLAAREKKPEISGIEFGVRLLKKQQKGNGLKIIEQIFTTIQNAPLPPNPYTSSAQQVAGIVNQAINALSPDGDDKREDLYAYSGISMDFDEDGSNCEDNLDKVWTGYTMFLLQPIEGYDPALAEGMLDVANFDPDTFCYRVTKQGRRPQFALKLGAKCSELSSSAYKNVNNPYVLLYLTAEKTKVANVDKSLRLLSDLDSAVALAAGTITTEAPNPRIDPAEEMFVSAASFRNLDGSVRAFEEELFGTNPDIKRAVMECREYGLALNECFGPDQFSEIQNLDIE